MRHVIIVCVMLLAACANPASTPTIVAPTSTTAPTEPPTDLSGQLLYTAWEEGLLAYNVVEQTTTPLYVPEGERRVLFADVSSDYRQVVLAIAAAPGEDRQPGPTSLYVMPIDGEPELFLTPEEGERFTLPLWSPDGAYIYYTREVNWSSPAPGTGEVTLERIAYPDGEREIVAENAFWAAFSPDGSQMAWVGREAGIDSLIIADGDATNPTVLLEPGSYPAIDAPTFDPGDESILFSAISGSVRDSERGWFTQWFGVQVAQAHEAPSDIWRQPLDGSDATRLTNIQDFGLYPDYAPDGDLIGLVRGSGLYLMQPDGSDMRRLLPPGPAGTLDWIP